MSCRRWSGASQKLIVACTCGLGCADPLAESAADSSLRADLYGVLPYDAGMAEKTARLDLRLTNEQKVLIEQAAEISGSTLAGFAIAQLTDAASQIVARSRSVVLDAEDWDIFVSALDASDEQGWIELKSMKPVWES